MKHLVTTLLTLALLAPLAACSEDSTTAPEAPWHQSSAVQDGLQTTIATCQASYEFGETVRIRATVKNVSDTAQTLTFERGNPARYPNVGVNVDDDGGFAVFVDGDGEQDSRTLQPGQSFTYEWSWDQSHRINRDPVDRGVYEVIGFVGRTDGETLRSTLDIELD